MQITLSYCTRRSHCKNLRLLLHEQFCRESLAFSIFVHTEKCLRFSACEALISTSDFLAFSYMQLLREPQASSACAAQERFSALLLYV